MANASKKSASASSKHAGAFACPCLFDIEPAQKSHSEGAEQSALNVPITKQRVARQSKSPIAYASSALSLFAEEPASSTKPLQSVVGPPEHHYSRVHGSRVSVVRMRKPRVSGSQRITTALETVRRSAFAVWTGLQKHAYPQIETTEAGVQVEYQLASVGRSELCRLTGKDRTTVRLAIRELEKRHLIALHKSADPYMRKPEIYRLYDPYVALERMRVRAIAFQNMSRSR